MPLQDAMLPDEVEIVRVIARPKVLASKPLVLEVGDFARRNYMSGISLWLATEGVNAINSWPTQWFKGTVKTDVGSLKKLGLRLFLTDRNGHFTVRCDGCDLSTNQKDQVPLCKKTDFTTCDFTLDNASIPIGVDLPIGLKDKLVQIFTLDIPIQKW